MKSSEKHIEEAVRRGLRDTAVPKSLEPDAVLEILQSREAAEKPAPQRSTQRRPRHMALAAAACAALAAGIGALAFAQNHGEWDVYAIPSSEEWKATMDARVADGSPAPVAQSYQEALACLREAYRNKGLAGFTASSAAAAGTTATDGVDIGTTSDATSPQEGTADFSDTNIRTEGVGEADIAKTDGRYLYIVEAESHAIAIVDTGGGTMAQAASIELDGRHSVSELCLDGNRLYVLGTEKDYGDGRKTEDADGPEGHSTTFVATYDIADPANPSLMGSVEQTGRYYSSCFADGYLYVVSNYFVPKNPKESAPEAYVPWINGQPIACESIYLPPTAAADHYYVISAISAEEPDRMTDSKAVLSSSAELYVGSDTIYLYEEVWGWDDPSASSRTSINALSYGEGHIESVAQTKVAGYLNDSFSIDEYRGYLRLVLTVNDEEGVRNRVLVLNDRLETVGAIEDLAPGEIVYSARLLGNIGYFVTYEQVDPLFTVDFSDPINPRIVGKLKIPGFSEYLHFYGADRLLGIGQGDGHVKLSMFDIANPADVIELNSYIVETAWQADASHSYKSVLIEPERNLIGFSAEADSLAVERSERDASDIPDDWSGKSYYVYSYNESEGFVQHMDEYIRGDGWFGARGVRIDETLYVTCGDFIESYSLETFERTGEIDLFRDGQ